MLALFDDACVLCNGVARFVMANDPAGRVRFAPLASPTASEAAAAYGGLPAVDSIVVIDDAGVHARSDAVLRSLRC